MTEIFFKYIFAQDGDTTAVPLDSQSDNTVSYDQGYSVRYSENLVTNPMALPFPRLQHNQILQDITAALQQYQTLSIPNFITTADNEGTAYSYSKFAQVLYDPGSGLRPYQSLASSNTALPTDATKWRPINFEATVTATGTANALTLTPPLAYLSYALGTAIAFKAASTNTSTTVTANISGLGAKNIKVSSALGKLNPPIFSIVANNIYTLIYDGTDLVLMNPSVSSTLIANVSLTTQTLIGDDSDVPIQYDTIIDDVNTWYDPVTYKLTPTVPGCYLISLTQFFTNFTGTQNANVQLGVFFNSTQYRLHQMRLIYDASVNGNVTLTGTLPLYLNGSTDFIQGFASLNMTGQTCDIHTVVGAAPGLAVLYTGGHQ